MKWPHWLRHAWSEWKPGFATKDPYGVYDYRNTDIRTCTVCGRRKMRSI